jgi:hypothetical protein
VELNAALSVLPAVRALLVTWLLSPALSGWAVSQGLEPAALVATDVIHMSCAAVVHLVAQWFARCMAGGALLFTKSQLVKLHKLKDDQVKEALDEVAAGHEGSGDGMAAGGGLQNGTQPSANPATALKDADEREPCWALFPQQSCNQHTKRTRHCTRIQLHGSAMESACPCARVSLRVCSPGIAR